MATVQSKSPKKNDLTAYHAMMQHMDRYLAMLESGEYGGKTGNGYGKDAYGQGETRGGYTPSPIAPQGMPYDPSAALKLGIGVGYAMAMRDKYGKDGAAKHCPTCSCGDHQTTAGGLESKLGYGKEKVVGRNYAKKGGDDNYKYH